MLKILQARLQQYVNQELPEVQAGYRKGRGTNLPTSAGSYKKQKKKKFQKNITKTFDYVDHNKL